MQGFDDSPVDESEWRLDKELVFVYHIVDAKKLSIDFLVFLRIWHEFGLIIMITRLLFFLILIYKILKSILFLVQVPSLLQHSVLPLKSSLHIARLKSQLRVKEV